MITPHISRRRFLQLGSSAVGMLLMPAGPANAYGFAHLLKGLFAFASSVGASVLSDNINRYLRQLDDDEPLKKEIRKENKQLVQRGFSDDSDSKVYENTDRLYYPLVQNWCGCKHFAAPFFDTSCGCSPITCIEGPHMTGLALAAGMLGRREGEDAARTILLPVQGGQLATGDRLRGYRSPLVYRSEEAQVAVHYEPRDDTSGTVIVEAQRERDGRSLINREWDVRYA